MVGGSTYAISLPKQWVEAMGLAPGDDVVVRVVPDGSVLVSPGHPLRRPPRRRAVALEHVRPDRLLRQLIGLYVAGVEIVTLTFKQQQSSAVRGAVDAACERLLGLQVVEETATSITVQDLADPDEFNIRKGLRMMHLNAHRMLEDLQAVLEGTTGGESAGLQRQERELDKLLTLIVKQHNHLVRDLAFSEQAGVSPEESLEYLLAAVNLERIGDYAIRTAPLLEQLRAGAGREALSELAGALAIASRCADDAVTAFFRPSVALANDAIERVAQLETLVAGPLADLPVRRRGTPDQEPLGVTLALAHVLEYVQRIGLYARSIAETAINHACTVEQAASGRAST